jgi:DNA polymerase elongation subunit (family B)
MQNSVIFDIETVHTEERTGKSRREDFDLSRNYIITAGLFDGIEASTSPVIENLNDENGSIEYFLKKLDELGARTLIGYNILRFDIPYLTHKSELAGLDFDPTQFRILDLYWILPYWLHNIPSGRDFYRKIDNGRSLWGFEDVDRLILKQEPNPTSNKEINRLWYEKEFRKIEEHLKTDLLHVFQFLNSSVIKESLSWTEKCSFEKSRCGDRCVFQMPLQKTSNKMVGYCALLQNCISEEKEMQAIDVVSSPLPPWGASWVPHCLLK